MSETKLNKGYIINDFESFIENLRSLNFLEVKEKKKGEHKEYAIKMKDVSSAGYTIFGFGKIGDITWDKKNECYSFRLDKEESMHDLKTFENTARFFDVIYKDIQKGEEPQSIEEVRKEAKEMLKGIEEDAK
jgi:hypothetical protein